MSGIPRTGLFSRNHVTSLSQRSRALAATSEAENENFTDNTKTETAQDITGEKDNLNFTSKSSLSNVNSPNSSSFTSLPRDPEGFEDLDAHFNRASTPQKTPKSIRKQQGQTPGAAVVVSRTGTPLSNRKAGASVLIAKPLKMISSKIAEHYKREPRVVVSMSQVLEAQQAEEFEAAHDEDDDNISEGEDRISRAKRELEEMSINSFDSSHSVYDTNDTEVHLSAYIKSTLSAVHADQGSSAENNLNLDHGSAENDSHDHYYADDNLVDDDVLMDRLVEEMLVNDAEDEEEKEVVLAPRILEPVTLNAADCTEAKKLPRKTTAAGKKQSMRRPLTYMPGTEFTESGQRRSCRLKMEPLRYWVNEKVCYGRAEDPSITLPVIVNVIKKPDMDDPTFAMGLTRKRRRPVDGNVAKLKAQAFGPDCDVEAEVICYERPDESEVRLVALSHHHVQGDPVKDNAFRIHTIFTEGSYMSSGQLIFPPLSHKPTKNSARHALVFYVITGSFRIEINRESFVVGPGGQFHVPRANHYTITHVTEDQSVEGRLFFCHCKDNAEM